MMALFCEGGAMKTNALVLGFILLTGAAGCLLFHAQAPAKPSVQAWKRLMPPPSIAVKEEVRGAPSGWTVESEDAPHILAGITFYDGLPADMGSLVYDSQKKMGTKLVLTWVLDPDTPRGSWIRCHYAGTNLVLDQQLPKGISAARVVLDTQTHVDGYEQILSIELR